ncbi:MAG: 2-C-methyl-D-erythritol 4-phosphate cytidylyltransferase [Flavobacteriales bacterium]|nr:2-C-methyl-D-erythritol 4-phosphate cytidylyltransferase [Flavobacteriales bacterium]MBK7619672.1 2-C-methyl-D-erythritol 4-phosphate cytidylyltransferase [Flavobacteriales bacterium]MBK8530788.1 2-C-methyl-D-erythritol 4-phosphate cytidylyltransferase [Flavobacteriales bacterium]
MQHFTIIVAGGSGKRMGSAVPKQFLLLKGKPLLCWTIDAFRAYDPQMPIIVVLPEAQIPIWKALCIGHGFHTEHSVVAGGEERFHSVRNGLAAVTQDGLVAVHDGVRPLVSKELIARCFESAEAHGSGIPVVPISSSVREVQGDSSRALDRSALRSVQTPQCFHTGLLRKAFSQPYDPAFTDEASTVERLGVKVNLVEGEEHNIKVTTPLDMQLAEFLL